jgi:outer membrane protein assembly factor BamB
MLSTLLAALFIVVALAGCRSSIRPGPFGPEGTPQSAVWSVRLPDDWKPIRAAQLIGDTVVVWSHEGVAALDRTDGATRWHHADFADHVYVFGDHAILLGGSTEPAVTVLDLATGATDFSYPLTGSAVVTNAGIVVIDCPKSGKSCAASGLDLYTGQRTWRRPVTGKPELVAGSTARTRTVTAEPAAVSDYTMPFQLTTVTSVLLTLPDGRTTVLDAATGQLEGSAKVAVGQPTVQPVGARRFLQWDPTARECLLSVAAMNTATGGLAWAVPVGQWTEAPALTFERPTCIPGTWQPVVTGGRLLAMTGDERPEVIDLDTGVPIWTGEAGSMLFGLIGRTAIIRLGHGTGDLAAIDIATNHRLWKRAAARPFFARVAVSADRIAYVTRSMNGSITAHLIVIDGGTGNAWAADGDNELLGLGPGWVIGGVGGQRVIDDGPAELRLFLR